ncbi:MAG TPA: hypothetical protein VH306_11780 [Gaiellaceae bacterium]|jgi:hypothetical protein
MAKSVSRILVLAARQPAFSELLEEAGYDVDVRTRPLERPDDVDADLAVVFRGRLIGRTQAASLHDRGIPVIEVMNVEPPSTSTAGWIRVSNRMTKPDLVQLVHAVADWAAAPIRTAARSAPA